METDRGDVLKMKTIGKRIAALRERADITQAKLSQMVGVTKSTMSKYENNLSVPNAELIGRLAEALNTTADYLIGRTSDCAPREKGRDWVQLSDRDMTIINSFRLLSSKNRIKVIERMETLLDEQKNGRA